MREKDTDCPTIPVISRLARQCNSIRELKQSEVQVSNFFEWNLMFKTPYDYLEMFITLGVVLKSDTICSRSAGISPMSDSRAEIMQIEDEINTSAAGLNSNFNSPKHLNQDNKPNTNTVTPSTFHGLVSVGNLEAAEQSEIRRKVRETSFQILEFIMCRLVCNPDTFKMVAYSVVAYSRRASRISQFE